MTTNDLTTATTLVLAEHAEKTAATITLRSIHAEHQNVVDEAIRETLKLRKSPLLNTGESLTPQDHFYREISKVEEIVNGFQLISERATTGSWSPRSVIVAILGINDVILTLMKDVTKLRALKKDEFMPPQVRTQWLH